MSEFWGLMLGMLGIALTMIGVVIAMMFWSPSEANELRKEQKEDRKNLMSLILSIQEAIKDFHYRLIEIEKNRK